MSLPIETIAGARHIHERERGPHDRRPAPPLARRCDAQSALTIAPSTRMFWPVM